MPIYEHNRQKGRTGPNKANAKIKSLFAELLESQMSNMENDLKYLSPKERVEVLIQLSKYIIPQVKKTVFK